MKTNTLSAFALASAVLLFAACDSGSNTPKPPEPPKKSDVPKVPEVPKAPEAPKK